MRVVDLLEVVQIDEQHAGRPALSSRPSVCLIEPVAQQRPIWKARERVMNCLVTHALVVAPPWPEFRGIEASQAARRMAGTLVLDANRFLVATLGAQVGLRYLSVGRAAA